MRRHICRSAGGIVLPIQILTSAGQFFESVMRQVDDFSAICTEVKFGMEKLFQTPVDCIIEVLHNFSRAILRDSEVKQIEGIAFLSNWLRRDNLLRILDTNLGGKIFLESFVGEGRKRLRAFPRGLVCHWIAGNIPTLGLFSLFQSMLAKNGNILRVPEASLSTVLPVLRLFSSIEIDNTSGKDLLESLAIVYFPSTDTMSNRLMSKVADARVVWGGKEAVEAITALPHSTHCEDVVFGPKYSLAAFDSAALESDRIKLYIRRLASDIVLFEQTACSSPHVIFVETDWDGIKELAYLLAENLKHFSKTKPKQVLDMGTTLEIINKRAQYALSTDRHLIASHENDWTILLDREDKLEEPIQSRTVFLKPIQSVMDILPLITKNIQTIGCAIFDAEKAQDFAKEVMMRGVSRCVPPGQMHIYDSPWDGILILNRLVRWNTLMLVEHDSAQPDT